MIKISDDVKHYGVKGMRWGIRKDSYKKYRQKQGRIAKNSPIGTDVERAERAKQSLSRQATKIATGVAIGIVASDVLQGKSPMSLSKSELQTRAIKVATATATALITKEALAASMSTRYTQSGKLKNPKESKKLLTREDKIEIGLAAAGTAYKMKDTIKMLYNTRLYMVAQKRAANEAAFKRMGGNILEEKFDNIVWRSSDGKQVIIDNVNAYNQRR